MTLVTVLDEDRANHGLEELDAGRLSDGRVVAQQKTNGSNQGGNSNRHSPGSSIGDSRSSAESKRRVRKLHFDFDLLELLAQEAAEESGLTEARLTALGECMSKLSDRQQEILRRCYMGSDTITEVAKGLGHERTALYKQLARLKDKLQDCMTRRLTSLGPAAGGAS